MTENDYLLLAGKYLVEHSRLARWVYSEGLFCAEADEDGFEEIHKTYGPFGRLMCWIHFSVGFEYLAKATCVVHGIADPKEEELKIDYPDEAEDITDWIERTLSGETQSPVVVKKYGTLHPYYAEKGHFSVLKQKTRMPDSDYRLLVAGTKLLASAVRNRDIHSYEKKVRRSNFYLVEMVFVPCLNTLIQVLLARRRTLLRDRSRRGDAPPVPVERMKLW